MGDRIYRCDWRREGGRITVWLIDEPALQVTRDSLEECREAIGDALMRRFNDPHAITEFSFSHPSLPPSFAQPELRTIWGEGSANCKTALADAYVGGSCKVCGRPVGVRTSMPLTVVKLPERVHAVRIARTQSTAYSEELLRSLGVSSGDRFELRPIQTLPRFRSARRFFEIIAANSACDLKPVGAAGLPGECTGWVCAGCGAFDVLHEIDGDFLRFVPADLASAPFLFMGLLCVEGERWRQACRDLKIDGNEAAQIGVVPRDLAFMPALIPRRTPAEFGIATQLQLA
jgi:hypothetical protein